jgi:hypothetical protein
MTKMMNDFRWWSARLRALVRVARKWMFERFELSKVDRGSHSYFTLRFLSLDLNSVMLTTAHAQSCYNVNGHTNGNGACQCIDIARTASVSVIGENGSGKSHLGRLIVTKCQKAGFAAQYVGARRDIAAADGVGDVPLLQMFKNVAVDDLQSREGKRPSALVQMLQYWRMVCPDHELFVTEFSQDLKVRRSVCGVEGHESEYSPNDLSDGEKGIFMALYHLFYDTRNQDSPSFRVLVVDEPEAHLHPSAVDSFWLALECAFPRILFIYMSHDLVAACIEARVCHECFSVSQVCARQGCAQSCDGALQYNTQIVRLDDVDVGVTDRILGVRRRNVLFVEGTPRSHDAILYKRILSGSWTVVCCGGATDVKRLVERSTAVQDHRAAQLVLGLIDGVYGEQTLPAGVHVARAAIVENLYVVPKVLKLLYGDRAVEIQHKALDVARECLENQLDNYKKVNKAAHGLELLCEVVDEKGSVADRFVWLLERWKSKGCSFTWERVFGQEWEPHIHKVRNALAGPMRSTFADALLEWLPPTVVPALAVAHRVANSAAERDLANRALIRDNANLLSQIAARDRKIAELEREMQDMRAAGGANATKKDSDGEPVPFCLDWNENE